ncbi:hypothetical protein TrRE_jg777, partial [Triparma retinervis]
VPSSAHCEVLCYDLPLSSCSSYPHCTWTPFGDASSSLGGHCDPSCPGICGAKSCESTGGRCKWSGASCVDDEASKTCYSLTEASECETGLEGGCFWLEEECGNYKPGDHCEADCEKHEEEGCRGSRGCVWRGGTRGCKRECKGFCTPTTCAPENPGICDWVEGRCKELED